MSPTLDEHRKLLEHVDRLLAEAPDEATRAEIVKLRERLAAPEIAELARELERSKPEARGNLVLEFHDLLVPARVSAAGCFIAATICLAAVVSIFSGRDLIEFAQLQARPALIAAFAGLASIMFTALSFARTFSVTIDTEGMVSTSRGQRWRQLRVGAMSWKSIRSLVERTDRVLEVRAGDGAVFEIPMRVGNYAVLRQHLDNMVRLFGDPPPARAVTTQ